MNRFKVSQGADRRRCVALALAVMMCVAMTGCGADSGESSSEERLAFRFFNNAGIGLSDSATTLRVAVVDSETGSVVTERSFDRGADDQSLLDEVEFSAGLRFLFEALDASGAVLATGGTRPIAVESDGSGVRQQYVFMTPPGAVAPTSALYQGGAVGPSDFTDGSARAGHVTVSLPDGRVMVIGGAEAAATGEGIGGSDYKTLYDTVLLYDMNLNGGYFDAIPVRLSVPRAFHTATVLDDGRVLVAGGLTSTDGQTLTVTNSVDVLDPQDDGSVSVLPLGAMGAARAFHTATALGGGQVLIAGGTRDLDASSALDSAEIYGVDQLSTLLALSMSGPRARHSANSLDGGRALLCGGHDGAAVVGSCELFQGVDQATFVPVAAMATARVGHVALSLAGSSGRYTALIGGFTDLALTQASNAIEFFDSTSGSFDSARSTPMSTARGHTAAIALHDGASFVVVGGINSAGEVLRSIELMRERSSGAGDYQGVISANLLEARHLHQALMLPSGMVLVTGGARASNNGLISLFTNELYNAGIPTF